MFPIRFRHVIWHGATCGTKHGERMNGNDKNVGSETVAYCCVQCRCVPKNGPKQNQQTLWTRNEWMTERRNLNGLRVCSISKTNPCIRKVTAFDRTRELSVSTCFVFSCHTRPDQSSTMPTGATPRAHEQFPFASRDELLLSSSSSAQQIGQTKQNSHKY